MPSFRIQIRIPSLSQLKEDTKETVHDLLRTVEKRVPSPVRPKEDTKAAAGEPPAPAESLLTRAEDAVVRAAGNAASFIEGVKTDIDAICDRDPAARSRGEVLLLYSGLHALLFYRASHALHQRGCYFPARLISQGAKFLTGIEIHPGATIGHGVFLDHGSGIVIGETAVVGDNCTLYQGVTLGGTGKDTGKRHPTLGKGVLVGAGAKLLGNFEIGDGAKIAAGAVVLRDVPPFCTAVGIPARVVRRGGERLPEEEMDQTHIPDPIALELLKFEERLSRLENAGNAAGKSAENTEESL